MLDLKTMFRQRFKCFPFDLFKQHPSAVWPPTHQLSIQAVQFDKDVPVQIIQIRILSLSDCRINDPVNDLYHLLG